MKRPAQKMESFLDTFVKENTINLSLSKPNTAIVNKPAPDVPLTESLRPMK